MTRLFSSTYTEHFIFGNMNAAWNDWSDAYYECVVDFGNNIDEIKIMAPVWEVPNAEKFLSELEISG